MKRLKLIPLYVLILLVVPVAVGKYNAVQQKLGREQALNDRLILREDSLVDRIDSLTKLKNKAAVVFYRNRIVWDTLPPLIPSLQVPDAPAVPATTLAQVIILGNETIKSCAATLTLCEKASFTKDTLIANVTQQRDFYRKQVPTAFDRVLEWGFRIGFFYLGTRVSK